MYFKTKTPLFRKPDPSQEEHGLRTRNNNSQLNKNNGKKEYYLLQYVELGHAKKSEFLDKPL